MLNAPGTFDFEKGFGVQEFYVQPDVLNAPGTFDFEKEFGV